MVLRYPYRVPRECAGASNQMYTWNCWKLVPEKDADG